MSDEHRRMQILDRIESGEISASEGLLLIQSLGNGTPAGEVSAAEPQPGSDGPADSNASAGSQGNIYTPPAGLPEEAQKWRRWWVLPFGLGVSVTILGGLLMYWALQTAGVSFWFFFAGLPMALGLVLMVLFWQTRSAHWLHLRIEQKNGQWPERIALSFPLPLRLTAWLLRRYGQRISSLQGTSLDEIIVALGDSTTADNPIFIQVEDDQDGERVQIYIG